MTEKAFTDEDLKYAQWILDRLGIGGSGKDEVEFIARVLRDERGACARTAETYMNAKGIQVPGLADAIRSHSA